MRDVMVSGWAVRCGAGRVGGPGCRAAGEFVAWTGLEARGEDDVELREVIVHMIEHADPPRERIDGRRGR
ncbi:hypothetical protein GCM10010112_80090 [Actinoplanes lobatus]|nr:hypothetical protein GCM10010112_80090 [Actinoplanes lobatus]